MQLTNLILITGGASSGKSTFAEKMAREANKSVTYLATMPRLVGAMELSEKIDEHQTSRSDSWNPIETTCEVATCMLNLPQGPGVVVLDCLSAYVSNLIIEKDKGRDQIIDDAKNTLDSLALRKDLQF